MRKEQFLRELGALLHDISEEERSEAMQYYEDYFADAGPDMEEKVAEELGSPEQVARTIKAGLRENDDGSTEDSRGEGYSAGSTDALDRQTKPADNASGADHAARPRRNGWKIAFIVLICILLLPVIIPVGLVLLAVPIGILAIIIGLVIAAFALTIGLLIGGVAAIAAGIIRLLLMPAVSIAVIGAGLLLLSLGLLTAVFLVWLVFKLVPPVIRWIVNLIRKPFNRRKGGRANEEGH